MESKFNIDYAILSNNQNPEYKEIAPWIIKRWNQLGIKCIYIDCFSANDPLPTDITTIEVREKWDYSELLTDENGNIYVKALVPTQPKVVWRWFPFTIARFAVASMWRFLSDKTLIITDGDLVPINKKFIFQPEYNMDMNRIVHIDKKIVSTTHYWDGRVLACYLIGEGAQFTKWIPFDKIEDIIEDAANKNWEHGMMYATEEWYLNWLADKFVENKENKLLYKCTNRLWSQGGQEISTLYDYQIDLLHTWQDLCPFVEFHGVRLSNMTELKWRHFYELLAEYDKYDITPPGWYYPSIQKRDFWRDTRITKDGYVMLGDEYDDPDYHHIYY